MVAAQTPTLAVIKHEASETDARALLYIAICEVCDFFNVGKNMSDSQVAMTADLILESFWHLRLEEIKYCFRRAMKTQKLYDRIDGNIIIGWLNDYDTERTEEAMRLSDQADARRLHEFESDASGMTLAEYTEYLREKAEAGDKDAAERMKSVDYLNGVKPMESRQEAHEKRVGFKQWFYQHYLKRKNEKK